jgi:hypothetical protein
MLSSLQLLAALVCLQAEGVPSFAETMNGPPPDVSPSAFACSVQTLRDDKECSFEGVAPAPPDARQQEKENRRLALQLAQASCEKALKEARGAGADSRLAAFCKQDMAFAVEVCGIDGSFPIVDEGGRFTAAAKPCYHALAGAAHHTSYLATLASGCCQCMAKAGCGGGDAECHLRLSEGAVPAAQKSCMESKCRQACSAALPLSSSEESASAWTHTSPPSKVNKKQSTNHEL